MFNQAIFTHLNQAERVCATFVTGMISHGQDNSITCFDTPLLKQQTQAFNQNLVNI